MASVILSIQVSIDCVVVSMEGRVGQVALEVVTFCRSLSVLMFLPVEMGRVDGSGRWMRRSTDIKWWSLPVWKCE